MNWPESYIENYERYDLPKALKNTLVLSDIHIPYHHTGALDEAINYGINKKIDSILLNGDVLDCYMLSKFEPDPRKRHFKDEIQAFKDFIYTLQEAFKVPIYYKLGNHEERYEKVMISRCPEFLDIPHFNFENVLGCSELRVNVIKDQRIIHAGMLPIFHGHELGMKSVNVNPARSLFLKINASGLCSHLHRTSQHTQNSLNEGISCYSTGHLGDEHPKYARINGWNHGIARVEKNETGEYEVINFPLKRNKLFAVA